MTGLTRLRARTIVRRMAVEAERFMGLETGCVLSGDRRWRVAHARQVVMLVATEELGLPPTVLGRFVRRDHSTVMAGVRSATGLVQSAPWLELHEHLVAVACAEAAHEACAPEPPPGASPVPQPAPPREADDEVWPGRKWWEDNDRAFVSAMRAVHPERERDLRR